METDESDGREPKITPLKGESVMKGFEPEREMSDEGRRVSQSMTHTGDEVMEIDDTCDDTTISVTHTCDDTLESRINLPLPICRNETYIYRVKSRKLNTRSMEKLKTEKMNVLTGSTEKLKT